MPAHTVRGAGPAARSGGTARSDDGTLVDALAALPEGGLVVALDSATGAHGGCSRCRHGMVDALIEVQTTGRVEQSGACAARG
jgi:hypothetical protein